MTIALPTAKTPPSLNALEAKVLLYGPPKIGKTQLAAALDPDHTLFIATEPGHGGVEVYRQTVSSWTEFLEVCAALASYDADAAGHEFRTIVIDTVDALHKLCVDEVLGNLGVDHASDLEYGKGWAAITDEFALKIAKLANLGFGLWMISHAKSEEVRQKVGTITVHTPTLSGGAKKFITGFVDYILYAGSEQTSDGETRVLRTRATENYEAGCRVQLPDPLPLDAGVLVDAMDNACRALTAKETA